MSWKPEDYAEQFDPSKRQTRKERKILKARDRSKYKQSNASPSQVFTPNQEHKRGRVLSIKSDQIVVDLQGSSYICTLRGALKKEKTRQKNLITVGDFVHVLTTASNEGSIVFIEKRYSHLSRAESLTHQKEQILAANIDQVFITTSVMAPPLKPTLVDRYIIAARLGNMEPVILINKIDLLTNPPPHIDPLTLENEQKLFKDFSASYGNLMIPLLAISTKTGEGIPSLKQMMMNKTSVFSGQSGVGKSSLINVALKMALKTGKVIQKTSKGAHTTTSAQLIALEGGGFCIDTPGIRSFGIWNINPEKVRFYFPDIKALSHHCQFPDCSHLHEPGCAVLEAVKTGALSSLRFDSYSALMKDIGEKHKPR